MNLTILKQRLLDFDPDVSWLEQTDEQMGDGFEKHARERLDAYNRGEWGMVGVRVVATLTDERGFSKVVESGGLWGIESDSDDAYFEEVAFEEWMVLREEVLKAVDNETFLRADLTFNEAEWEDQ